MTRKHHYFSVFRRLAYLYAITIIVIYMIMVSLFLSNINRTSDELVNTRKAQAQTFMQNLEQQLGSSYDQQVNLVDDISVTKLAYSLYADSYEKTQLILRLTKTVQDLKSMNPLVSDIIVTFPNQSITISANNGYEKKEFVLSGKKILGADYNSLVSTADNLELIFTYPLMFSIGEDYKPDFIIETVLSKSSLNDSLKAFVDDQGSSAALVYQSEMTVIIGEGNEDIVGEWINNQDSVLGKKVEKLSIEGSTFAFMPAESTSYPLTVLTYINKQVLDRVTWKYIVLLTVIIIAISFLFLLTIWYSNRIIAKPLKEMIHAFDQIQEGVFDIRIYHRPNDEFNYLYQAFNHTVAHIQELITNIYEQKNLRQNAELAQLQSQINPHFLYNSFFIINRMAKNESYDQITQFVTSLAKYYRFINKEPSNFISLETEVEHMNNYIDIQQMRFGDKITALIDTVPENVSRVKVPKLILQPLIENIYNYGFANKLSDGLLKVSFLQEGSYVDIVVEDNGDDVNDVLIEMLMDRLKSYSENQENDENHALVNINRRIKLAYGEKCGVIISRSELGGLKVAVKIDKEVSLKG